MKTHSVAQSRLSYLYDSRAIIWVWLREPTSAAARAHTFLYLLCWAYSVCVLFALLFQQCGTLCHVCFSLLFAVSFAGHFESTMVPYEQHPNLHSEKMMVPYHLGSRFMLRTWLRLPENTHS